MKNTMQLLEKALSVKSAAERGGMQWLQMPRLLGKMRKIKGIFL